jgi:hypothetical protein|tara:strand:- start:2520 stop:3122 length:603 start_codon:yes stop_codon:yes gene_type:complete
MPNYTYITNIPASSNNPSADQPNMQINTNSIDDIIEVDHFSFNDNLGGYHKQVNLVNSVANPGTPAGVGSVLFSKSNDWYFQNASLGLNAIQMTNAAYFPIQAINGGRTFLPGGMIMQWGFVVAGGTFSNFDTGAVVFPVAFPTIVINVLTTPGYGGAQPTSTSGMVVSIKNPVPNSGFTWAVNTGSSAYNTFYWQALGY